ILEILLRFPARNLVQRRLRNEEMTPVDELAHLAVEERQQQRADMGAVGVRHDDDLVIAQLLGIELVADAGAERSDQRSDLLACEHLVEPRALHIENLSAQRQHGLKRAIAALLGGAASTVTL